MSLVSLHTWPGVYKTIDLFSLQIRFYQENLYTTSPPVSKDFPSIHDGKDIMPEKM